MRGRRGHGASGGEGGTPVASRDFCPCALIYDSGYLGRDCLHLLPLALLDLISRPAGRSFSVFLLGAVAHRHRLGSCQNILGGKSHLRFPCDKIVDRIMEGTINCKNPGKEQLTSACCRYP